MKLGIGTVQFGMGYGVSNNQGKTSLDEVKAILHFALENGIKIIDTAYSYGDSERVLGMSFPENHGFHIITKTPVFKRKRIDAADAGRLVEAFYDSLKSLKKSDLYGLLIHNAEDLLTDGGELLFNKMHGLKQKGLVKKIGVSVYTAGQIDDILDRYPLDLIQLPINVLDQRLVHSGHLARLKEKGVEIHARSIFLQGLLLTETESLPSFFDPIKPKLKNYKSFITSLNLTPIEGCFAFIKAVSEIDYPILGINNMQQLRDNLHFFDKNYGFSPGEFIHFSVNDTKYLNPGLWKIN